MTERINMEAPVAEKASPKVAYSEIFNNIDGHKNLTMEERVQVKAIDIMVDALRGCSNVEADFPGMTLGDNSRLTDLNCPEYELDLLWGVHTPEELFERVVEFASEKSKDGGFLERWKENMRDLATPNMPKDNGIPDQARAKKLVRDFLAKDDTELAIATGSTTGLW